MTQHESARDLLALMRDVFIIGETPATRDQVNCDSQNKGIVKQLLTTAGTWQIDVLILWVAIILA